MVKSLEFKKEGGEGEAERKAEEKAVVTYDRQRESSMYVCMYLTVNIVCERSRTQVSGKYLLQSILYTNTPLYCCSVLVVLPSPLLWLLSARVCFVFRSGATVVGNSSQAFQDERRRQARSFATSSGT